MMTNMGWGVFLMYALLTYAGVGFIWLCMPETKVMPSDILGQCWHRADHTICRAGP